MSATDKPRKSYPSDITDEQWQLVEPLLIRKPGPGRPTEVDLREVLNAIFYLNRTGCQWRMIPHDFPHFSVVRYYRDKWKNNGVIEAINRQLRQQVRIENGRDPEPTLAIVDSQSVKTTEEAREEKGIDGNKKIKGRRRQLLVDVMGNLLGIVVHAANVSDVIGGSGPVGQLPRASAQAAQGTGGRRLQRGVGEVDAKGVWRRGRGGVQGARKERFRCPAEAVGGRANHRLVKSLSTII